MVRFETQNTEYDDRSEHAGRAVDQGYGQGVFFAVVFHVVVRRVSDNSSEPQAERKENLGRCISPYSWIRKSGHLDQT